MLNRVFPATAWVFPRTTVTRTTCTRTPRASGGVSQTLIDLFEITEYSPRQRGGFLRAVWRHERARGLPRISGGVSRSVTEISASMFYSPRCLPLAKWGRFLSHGS